MSTLASAEVLSLADTKYSLLNATMMNLLVESSIIKIFDWLPNSSYVTLCK